MVTKQNKPNLFEKTFELIFNKRVILVLLTALCLAIFKNKIDDFLLNFFAKKVFCHSNSSIFLDISFIAISLIFLFYLIYRGSVRYKFIFIQYFIAITLFLLYSYYRFSQQEWDYLKYTFSNTFNYLDFILLTPTYLLVFLISQLNQKENSNPEIFFIEDSPTDSQKASKSDVKSNDNKTDLFKRKGYAKLIANRLKKQRFESAFAVGILGEWGYGKTCFLRFMEDEFKNEESILIHFSPWDHHNEDSMFYELFNVLAGQFGINNPQLQAEIDSYGKSLLKIDKTGLGELIFNLISIKDENLISKKYNHISNEIRKSGKQIIVFIDDLDRLSSSEIVELLKLIRNTANFPNTIYMVAFDKDYVIEALKDISKDKSSFYIEKFFQLEISLPLLDQSVIRKEFINYISQQLNEEQVSIISGEISSLSPGDLAYKHTIFGRIVNNLRDAKKFANLLNLDISQLSINSVLEVDTKDFLYISLLKYRFPFLYSMFYRDAGLYLNLFNGVFELDTKEKDKENVVKIFALLDSEAIEINDRQLAKDLINELFGESREIDPRNLSIRIDKYFNNYFGSQINPDGITESEFRKLFTGDIKNAYKILNSWLSNKSDTLYEKFRDFRPGNKQEFEVIIRCLFYISFTKEKDVGLSTEFLLLIIKKFDSEKIIKANIYRNQNEINKFIRELFESKDYSINFKSNFIKRLLDNNTNHVEKKQSKASEPKVWGSQLIDWQEIQRGILSDYIINQSNLNSQHYKLWENCQVQFKDFTKLNEASCNDFLRFIRSTQSNFETFIESFAIDTKHAPVYQLDGMASFIYSEVKETISPSEYNQGKVNGLRKIMEDLDESPKIMEFNDFLTVFEGNNFGLTNFDFKEIKINNTPKNKIDN